MKTFIVKIINKLFKSSSVIKLTTNEFNIEKFKELEGLINQLKHAYYDSNTGGVFHNIKYYDKLKEVSFFIKNNEFGVEKPEHFHYNSITNWYYKNINNLNKSL